MLAHCKDQTYLSYEEEQYCCIITKIVIDGPHSFI